MTGNTLLVQWFKPVAACWCFVLGFFIWGGGRMEARQHRHFGWLFYWLFKVIFVPFIVRSQVVWPVLHYQRTLLANLRMEVKAFDFVVEFNLLLIFQPQLMVFFVLHQAIFRIKPWVCGRRQIYVADRFALLSSVFAYPVGRKGALFNLFRVLLHLHPH
jgi:hypothetical protein